MKLLRAFLGRMPLLVGALLVLGMVGVASPARAEVVTITPANVNDYLSADALTRGWIEGCPSDSASPSGLCAGSVTDPEGGEGAILLSVSNEYVDSDKQGQCIGRETTLGVSNFRGVSRMSFESAQVQVDDLADLVGDGSNPYQIVYHYRLADGSVNQGSDWVRLKIKGPGQLGKVLFIENKPAGVETPVGNGWIRVDLSDPNLAWRWSGGLPSDDKPLSAWVSQFVAEDKRTGIQELLLDIGSNDLGLEACTYDGPRPNPDKPRKAPSEPTVKYGFYLDYLTLKPANAAEAKQVNFQLGAAPPSFDVSLTHIFTVDRVVTEAKMSQYLADGGDVEGFSIDEDDAGTYEVRGIFDWSRYAGASGDKFSSGCVNLGSPDPFVDGLISVEQFGKNSTTGKVNQINTGKSAFWCMKNLKGGAGFERLDTSNLTTFYEMFRNANKFEGAVGGFDTSNVTNFSFAFDDARLFNTDITGWKTENATNMYQMFTGATAFNQPIGSWTTDSVTNMGNMFQNATAFNQPLGNWNVSSVEPSKECNSVNGAYACNKGLSGMFARATSFNQDLSAWNVAAFGGSEPQPNSQGQEFDAGARAWDGVNPTTGVAWCNDGRPLWGGGACPTLPPVISQCEAGDQQIRVVFNADPGATGNVTNIAYSVDGGANYTTRSPASTDSPLVLSNLTNGTSYSVFIKAIAGGDESEPSEANCTETPFGPASAPLNLVATAGDGLITVDFDPPADTNGDVITHYEYSVDGAGFVSSGNDTPSITVTGLTNGTTYSIRVRAVGALEGQASAAVTATPLPSSTAPGKPSGLALSSGDKALVVSFGAAAANGSAITDYEYSLDGADFRSSGVTTSPFTIDDLTNGQSYTVAVRARNAVGVGPATAPKAGVPVGVPGVPINLVATPGDTQAFVAFTAPADNGADITDYEYRVDGGASVSTGDVTPSITVTGLTNGTSYQIEVRAENSKGTGAWSAAVAVTPESGAEPPDAPTITGAFRVNSDILVEFTAGEDNGAEITDYEYRVALNGAFTSSGVTASPITLASQNPADGISVSIRAVNAEGPGPDSALWLVPAEKPFPPQGNVRAELTLVGSECDITYTHATGAPAGISAGLDVELDFGLENCDPGESVSVSIDLGTNLPDDARAHKVNPDGTFTEIEGATYTATSVSYVIVDDQGQGDYTGLDRNPQAMVVEDPIVIMVPLPPPSAQPVLPVPLPYWLLAILMGSVGWMGYRRLSTT